MPTQLLDAVSLASPSNASHDSLHCNRTLSFAHCIVGRPRTFVNRCVQQSIVTNVLKAMPGTSTSFLCLRLPSNATKWNEKADYSLSSELDVRNAAERFRLMTNVAAVQIEGDEPVPAELRADILRDDELAHLFQMWRNIQGCFNLVLRHERAVGQKFSFITRLRPDAVFFDRWALPPFSCHLRSMLIPKGAWDAIPAQMTISPCFLGTCHLGTSTISLRTTRAVRTALVREYIVKGTSSTSANFQGGFSFHRAMPDMSITQSG